MYSPAGKFAAPPVPRVLSPLRASSHILHRHRRSGRNGRGHSTAAWACTARSPRGRAAAASRLTMPCHRLNSHCIRSAFSLPRPSTAQSLVTPLQRRPGARHHFSMHSAVTRGQAAVPCPWMVLFPGGLITFSGPGPGAPQLDDRHPHCPCRQTF
ncbi:hypothetical protein NDU88_006963 [Pleurodeles waltl]|uniref:Uncharacterized protein n=1 Tax=Pleurodeles waltl TaxID=8319 RepID=A0AAV7N8V5_PLEWA|nr:hypothetical protein NDU88_006963 [Pleurodeles waltl]